MTACPDLAMSDIGALGVLENYMLNSTQQNTLQNTVILENLQSNFHDLSGYLKQQFDGLRKDLGRDEEIRLGSRLTRQRSISHEDRLQDSTGRNSAREGELEATICDLRNSLDRATTAYNTENSARLRESHHYQINYKDWKQKETELGAHLESLRAQNKHLEAAGIDKEENGYLTMAQPEKEQLEIATSQKYQLEVQVGKMRGEMKILQKQALTLRNLLKHCVDKGEQKDDNEIVCSFTCIYRQVSQVAGALCPTETVEVDLNRLQPGRRRDFFSYWSPGVQFSTQKYRMIAMIFEIICDTILQRKNFGMDNFDSMVESEVAERVDVESGLNRFEIALMDLKQGSDATIAEWRVCTLKCASLLNITSARPKEVATIIQEYMAPLWPQAAAADDKLFVLVETMCKEAFDFSMSLRASRDIYCCELPAPGSRLGDSSMAMARSQELSNNSSLTDQDIMYTLSPALVKYPLVIPGNRLVLQQALVIVF